MHFKSGSNSTVEVKTGFDRSFQTELLTWQYLHVLFSFNYMSEGQVRRMCFAKPELESPLWNIRYPVLRALNTICLYTPSVPMNTKDPCAV